MHEHTEGPGDRWPTKSGTLNAMILIYCVAALSALACAVAIPWMLDAIGDAVRRIEPRAPWPLAGTQGTIDGIRTAAALIVAAPPVAYAAAKGTRIAAKKIAARTAGKETEEKKMDYPIQGQDTIGCRVMVSFDYDIDHAVPGTVIRDDMDEPYLTIIKLDDGRVVLGKECQWRAMTPGEAADSLAMAGKKADAFNAAADAIAAAKQALAEGKDPLDAAYAFADRSAGHADAAKDACRAFVEAIASVGA